jgi:hypothetical protein
VADTPSTLVLDCTVADGGGFCDAHLVHRRSRLEVARCPLLSYQEVCSFLGWSIAAYFLGAYLWYRSKSFAAFAMPMVFLFALAAWLLPRAK